jgi:hypothetical protein
MDDERRRADAHDVHNRYLVGVQGEHVIVMAPPALMAPDDALNLAAHLVALAQPYATLDFAELLAAVEST